ncbi:hypothetical protein LGM65_28040 [Burkholderia anthina]|uniref:hypothetical protein n=1 Tax=Burkholderia anthina TaxID=179879 RepID=UPI001CF2D549|nr:hypothetical protein [Burkholderia anthina]MCA8094682.1 hypothetical protein [Burkholderia anthina]
MNTEALAARLAQTFGPQSLAGLALAELKRCRANGERAALVLEKGSFAVVHDGFNPDDLPATVTKPAFDCSDRVDAGSGRRLRYLAHSNGYVIVCWTAGTPFVVNERQWLAMKVCPHRHRMSPA